MNKHTINFKDKTFTLETDKGRATIDLPDHYNILMITDKLREQCEKIINQVD